MIDRHKIQGRQQRMFDPLLFKQVYGDGFVSKARLGERLYITYEAQITDTSITSKAEVKAAMEAKVSELLSADAIASTPPLP